MKFIIMCGFLCLLVYCDAVAVDCTFQEINWRVVGKLYTCYVKTSLKMTSKEVSTVDSFSPSSSQDVKFFRADSVAGPINYFPRNLEKLFPGLEGIRIHTCGLKEIHVEDLKPFPDLKFFEVHTGGIEVLPSGLFAFNPDLKVVGFISNKIAFIDPAVFDNLHQLTCLWMSNNKCIDSSADENSTAMEFVRNEAKSKCPDLSHIEKGIRMIEDENFHVRAETFSIFEKRFNDIKSKLESLDVTTRIVQSLIGRLNEAYEVKFGEIFKPSNDDQTKNIEKRLENMEEMLQKTINMIANLTTVENAEAYSKCEGEWRG